MKPARDAAFQIVELLRDAPPFSSLDYRYVKSKVDAVFTEDYLQNAADFAKSGSLAGAVSPEYQKAMTLLRVLPVMAHMGYSLGEFKRELIPFAEKLTTATGRQTAMQPALVSSFPALLIYHRKTPAGCPLQILRSSM